MFVVANGLYLASSQYQRLKCRYEDKLLNGLFWILRVLVDSVDFSAPLLIFRAKVSASMPRLDLALLSESHLRYLAKQE